MKTTKIRKTKYQVHWKGYNNPKDHTWEYAEEMDNAQEIMKEYHKDNPKKPRPGNWIHAI
jgi:Chromo (CHRromatin Organisation MOdifier) domain